MNRNAQIVIPVLLIIGVSACVIQPADKVPPGLTATATIASTATPSPTPTILPAASSTAVPPLAPHAWSQSEPLITFGSGFGDGACGFEAAFPIDFTLFPNGELYRVKRNSSLDADEILTTTLSRRATCNLLNSIDQAGFFDYDPATYAPDHWGPPVMGLPSTQITVRAWRSNSIDLYELGLFVSPAEVERVRQDWAPQCGACPNLQFPTIMPALRKTYSLLSKFQPDGLHIYEPGTLAVWVAANGLEGDAKEWPLKSRKLESLRVSSEFAGEQPNLILSGADASTVYSMFKGSFDQCGLSVSEGGMYYRVLTRPLLPNELPTAGQSRAISLRCSPEDGWTDVP